jgi:hypothetical protein
MISTGAWKSLRKNRSGFSTVTTAPAAVINHSENLGEANTTFLLLPKRAGSIEAAQQRRIVELERLIGRQQMEIRFLDKALHQVEERRQQKKDAGAVASWRLSIKLCWGDSCCTLESGLEQGVELG